MKRKYCFAILFLALVIFLTGCSGGGIVTLNNNNGVCEDLLRGFYITLSSENFTQALSYCKSGGLTADYVYDLWELKLKYPQFHTTYQISDVYNFFSFGGELELYYDYSWTIRTSYLSGRRMVFENINGEWKMF